MDNLKFNLPHGYGVQQLVDELAGHYPVKKEEPLAEKLAFYDTFDWRLYQAGLMLSESAGELCLSQLATHQILQRQKITPLPVFVKDFPDSQLKEQLAPILEMRALLLLVEIQTHSTPYRILNQDEKTVAWLVFEEIKPAGGKEAAGQVWVKPVRGYPKELQQVANHLQIIGCSPAEKDAYLLALEAVGRQPGDYSAKLNIRLDPQLRADEATKVILRFLLNVMKRNEPYVKKDVDPEFLHDFRVAVRRTRSALSQIKNVFPAETTDRFKQDFARIGRLSNDLRDLDVYLLAEDTYRAMLPDILRNSITPLFNYLREKRAEARQKVVAGLNAPEYARVLHDWEAFLAEPPLDSPSAGNAALPIIQLAQDRIYKRYRRIVKSGRQILENTADEQLHALRIEGKKLRYLLEFFAGLFPADEIETLLKQLKRLQDNLGHFNDLCVQEQYLLNVVEELPLNGPSARKTLLAVGGLIGSLDQQRQRVKGEFAKTFTAFASASNRALFQKLFAPEKKEVAE
ncbi:MAG: CHAD domain-containing protein [Anaerolineae bacterium]|nr:CHAD domain-containing protein [Anaerolineae bacterium]